MSVVTILMSTYNGEKYLQEQLDSLYKQENVEIHIVVRDDGSTDTTREILEANHLKGKLDWYTGENKKPAQSFMDLVYNSSDSDYYAFCDQDDVWLPDKLERAVKQLERVKSDKPALYYGHPRLADTHLNPIESSKRTYDRFLDFTSAMINSNCTGCTMVLNLALMKIVKSKKPSYVFMHDSWIHKICLSVHGNLIYDDDVHILYRQHGNNVIGGTTSASKRLKGHFKSLTHANCIRSKTIYELLECYGEFMTTEEKKIASDVAFYKKNFFTRISLLLNLKIKTPYMNRNILYKLAVTLGVF